MLRSALLRVVHTAFFWFVFFLFFVLISRTDASARFYTLGFLQVTRVRAANKPPRTVIVSRSSFFCVRFFFVFHSFNFPLSWRIKNALFVTWCILIRTRHVSFEKPGWLSILRIEKKQTKCVHYVAPVVCMYIF